MTNARGRGKAQSPNFQFLKKVDPLLVELGMRAELYALEDPVTSLMKTRQMGELLAQIVASKFGIATTIESRPKDQRALIDDLYRSRAFPFDVKDFFHSVRREGNDANHAMKGDQGRAITALRHVRRIAVWFYRTHVNKTQKLGTFIPPVATPTANKEAIDEIEKWRKAHEDSESRARALEQKVEDETLLRKEIEKKREQAYQDLEAMAELVEEDREQLEKKIAELSKSLAELSIQTRPTQEQSEKMIQAGEAIANEELTEADTRELIDMQLRSAGWIVDSATIRHSKGVRPQKSKNMAIAEWPTSSGPADYVLFLGLMPVGIIEAKRENADVAGAITQAQRYSETYNLSDDETAAGGPWNNYKIPFLFSTNGRDYLKQIKTKSGIWFQDARRETNLPRAILGWYSPDGLRQRLNQDIVAANDRLSQESTDYLPLRDYQQEAVEAVEQAIRDGQREMLIGMATGTGKTRTCIALCYRLIKANRFRRILFLVDRTSLGQQTADSLKDLRIENNQSFTDIYDVKELGDLKPDSDTKFQIATIQGMVQRLLDTEGGDGTLSVDQYDCIVVDECHRGYNLDQEMSEGELRFRDEADYISKYSRVIEYFDAVKIGLTATPAIHTLEIFGGPRQMPIYQYSYQQAVIDGYLVDHEPPLRIGTKLGKSGIQWAVGEEIQVYDTRKKQTELFQTPDEIDLQIDSFNRKVINEDFNRVICEELAKHIDPSLPGKTLVFCVTDDHANMVVDELKKAFTKQWGSVKEKDITKITSKADKPLQQIRRFKNERSPSVVVTVDLLTTGIDVPAIDKIVFLRRVRSRILYDQMLGRATRLCEDLHAPDEDKECFYIFDCVDLYAALKSHTDMKPVVTRPNITVRQLVDELVSATNDDDRQEIKRQLVAKLQRKKRHLRGDRGKEFEQKAGTNVGDFIEQIQRSDPGQINELFANKTALVEFLDTSKAPGGVKIYVSNHEDEVVEVARGFGKNNIRPKDYLEEFRDFVTNQQKQIAALTLCATRPRDLTRQSLKELKIELDNHGFSETRLRVAWRETKNVEIAATIIGYVRNAILNAPLLPFDQRVDDAMNTILASSNWTNPQRKWLERIGKQFKENTLVDRDAIDSGRFAKDGGFDRLNKVFDGKLDELLKQITDEIWDAAA